MIDTEHARKDFQCFNNRFQYTRPYLQLGRPPAKWGGDPLVGFRERVIWLIFTEKTCLLIVLILMLVICILSCHLLLIISFTSSPSKIPWIFASRNSISKSYVTHHARKENKPTNSYFNDRSHQRRLVTLYFGFVRFCFWYYFFEYKVNWIQPKI